MYVSDIYKKIIRDPDLLWAGSLWVESGHKIILKIASDKFYLNPD